MFGHSLLGSFQDDPYISFHQQMSSMNQLMQDPFGMMGGVPTMGVPTMGVPTMGVPGPVAITDGRDRQRDMALRGERSRELAPRPNPMDPFGMSPFFGGVAPGGIFASMNMMANMQQQQMSGAMMPMNNPNGHSFSQSTVMSYSNTGNGAPRVYQATTARTQAPGGVVETRKSVRDSEAAVEKVHVGRYIGDRGHTREKQRDTHSGDVEENEECINQDEEDLPRFNSEFQERTHPYQPPSRHSRLPQAAHTPLALTDGRLRYTGYQRDRSSHRRDPHTGYRERD